jgi:Protein of unknown function (DUF3014)
MQSSLRWLIPLLVVLLGAGVVYYFWRAGQPEVQPPAAPSPQPTPAPSAAPAIQHPIEEAGAQHPEASLPALGESDQALRDALSSVIGAAPLERYVLLDGLVRRIAATVDALPRRTVPQRVLPLKPLPGTFATVGEGEALRIAPENAARYAPLVRLVQDVDARKLVAVYVTFYPLFQQAYVELGYPHGYFNDRLIVAIDDMLAAPEAPEPVRLVQPKILYAYADPELEALSAGQKLMLRMGKENATRVKAKLREIRRALTASSVQPPS